MTGQDEREICARIVRAREQAHLTQSELAAQIGVTERTIRNYESGRVPWGLLKKIADATGTTRAWLVDGPSQLDRMEAKIDRLVAGLLIRQPDEDQPARRLPEPPHPPDRQPGSASDGRPKRRRKAS